MIEWNNELLYTLSTFVGGGALGGLISAVVNHKENRRIKKSEASRSEATAKREDVSAAAEMMGLLERTVAHTDVLQAQRAEDYQRITALEEMMATELAWRKDGDYHYCEVEECVVRKPPLGTFRRVHATEAGKVVTVVLVAVLLLVGCRPARVVSEKRSLHTDSVGTVVWRDSTYVHETGSASVQTDVHRVREESAGLESESRIHDIYYDTAAPVDTATGRPPVARETFTATGSRSVHTATEDEVRHSEAAAAVETVARAESGGAVAVEKRVADESEWKEKTRRNPWKYALPLAALAVGVGIGILVKRGVKKVFAARNND